MRLEYLEKISRTGEINFFKGIRTAYFQKSKSDGGGTFLSLLAIAVPQQGT